MKEFTLQIDKRAMVQGNLNELSFIGHVVQEISTMKRAKIKPALKFLYKGWDSQNELPRFKH